MNSVNANNNKKHIQSLQALRAIAFLGIFLTHAGSSHGWSALGVSIFFVMSGFLMSYTKSELEFSQSIKDSLSFAIGRIKKIYPLHLITMAFAIVLNVFINIDEGLNAISIISRMIFKIVANVTLTQAWIPNIKAVTSLNGVAWYLSAALFMYYMYPYIHNFIKNKSVVLLITISILILLLQLILCSVLLLLFSTSDSVYIWFSYFFPLFRLADFFVGACLGKLYLEVSSRNVSLITGSVIEIIATLLTVSVIRWINIGHEGRFAQATSNWTTLFIIISAVWVYLFTLNQGIITKLLSNRILLFIGNISSYTFLIHTIIINTISFILKINNIVIEGLNKTLLIASEFVIVIILSYLYGRVRDSIVK